jgi:hypothetical protein
VTQYHVTLNSQGYVLDLDRYKKRVRDPFVTRQSQGAVAIADLRGPEQVLVVDDWSGGEGYTVHDPEQPGRYRSGSGIDGYSVPGSLRLGPRIEVIGTSAANDLRALAGYKSKVFAAGTNGIVYSWDGSTFATAHTVSGTPELVAMALYLDELFVSNTGGGSVASFDGTTWTNTRFTAGGGVHAMQTHYRQAAQYLYVGAAGAGVNGTGRLQFWDNSAISSGQFDTEESRPTVLVVVGQELFVMAIEPGERNFSIYSVDNASGGGVWRRYRVQEGEALPLWATAHDNAAYVGDIGGGRLYRWDGRELTLAVQLSQPGGSYGGAVVPKSWRGAIWMGIVDTDGTLGVMRYDPKTGARHRPITGQQGSDWRSAAVWVDKLYLGNAQSGAAKLFRVNPAQYGGSGKLVSGLVDCGLPGVTKLFRSVTIVCAAMPASHSIQVEYQLEDTGSWVSLGTLSMTNATTATYAFGANVTGKQIAFRLTLTGVAGAVVSPVLYELSLRYVPRPAVTREWELAVVLEGTAELPLVTLDGAPDPLTGAQLTTGLWAAAAATGPVTLVDLDGVSYSVYVEDVREEMAKVSQRKGYQRVGLCRLVEAA